MPTLQGHNAHTYRTPTMDRIKKVPKICGSIYSKRARVGVSCTSSNSAVTSAGSQEKTVEMERAAADMSQYNTESLARVLGEQFLAMRIAYLTARRKEGRGCNEASRLLDSSLIINNGNNWATSLNNGYEAPIMSYAGGELKELANAENCIQILRNQRLLTPLLLRSLHWSPQQLQGLRCMATITLHRIMWTLLIQIRTHQNPL